MNPQVTIDLSHYDSLCEDSAAFQKIKKGQPYLHFYTGYTIGGRYTEVTSNDERFLAIKSEVTRIREDLSLAYAENRKLKDELKSINKRGFFKRLFS